MIYSGYWGTYTFDKAQGTLKLVAQHGNYVPADLDGEGIFSIDKSGKLVLKGIWLGTYRGALRTQKDNARLCGHIFGP